MQKVNYKIFPGADLTEAQIYETTQTFDRNAEEYANKWEWAPKEIKEIMKYNIKPFTKYTQKGDACLIAGCQSGRDYSLLSKEGICCIGVNNSHGMLVEAIKRVPHGLFMQADLRSLPFLPESFDLVYADALTRIPRKDLKATINDYKIFLKNKGYIYLSFHVGKTGIYVQEDSVGKRYQTLYEKSELIELIKDLGLKIVWSAPSEPLVTSLPGWLSIIGQKSE